LWVNFTSPAGRHDASLRLLKVELYNDVCRGYIFADVTIPDFISSKEQKNIY
jgi:hypothetical protein